MTINDAINSIDTLEPNDYTQEEKIKWLSQLDTLVHREVISTHEDEFEFNGYGTDTPLDTELIVKEPYDELYISWLQSKINFHNGEYSKYNNSIIRYNDTYGAYYNDYNRHHKPKTHNVTYF